MRGELCPTGFPKIDPRPAVPAVKVEMPGTLLEDVAGILTDPEFVAGAAACGGTDNGGPKFPGCWLGLSTP